MRGYHGGGIGVGLFAGLALLFMAADNSTKKVITKNPNEAILARLVAESMEKEGISSGEEYNHYRKIANGK